MTLQETENVHLIRDTEKSELKRRELLSSLLDFSDSDLPEVVKQVRDWILQYDHIFALDGKDLGRTDLVQHDIDTDSHAPIQQRPKR